MTQAELDDPLLLQFAAGRPDDMAALLANANLSELSSLIESLPMATAASLIARLPSWQVTGLMRNLEPALIARMLTTARSDEAVALVSHINESRYTALLQAVSPGHRRTLQELLEFPSHSVASMVSTAFIRVQEDMLCGVFSEQLAASTDTSPRSVLVVDNRGKYLGMLSLQAIYARKNRSRPSGEVALPVEALNGLTDAKTALSARQWLKYLELPVIDSRHRIIGVVSRASLARVAGASKALDFSAERVVAELATGYLETCARVLEAVLGKSR